MNSKHKLRYLLANVFIIICLFFVSIFWGKIKIQEIEKRYEDKKTIDSLRVSNRLKEENPEIKIKERLIEIYNFNKYDASIYSAIIFKSSQRFSIEWEKIAAKIKVESHFDPFIKSKLTKILAKEKKQSAYGWLQLKPLTARECANDLNIEWNGIPTLYNPITNTFLGTYYYAKMEVPFKKDFEKSEKAYNVGLTGFYKGYSSERHWLKVFIEYKKLKGLDFSVEEKKLKKFLKQDTIQVAKKE